jgi:hypothetical protein
MFSCSHGCLFGKDGLYESVRRSVGLAEESLFLERPPSQLQREQRETVLKISTPFLSFFFFPCFGSATLVFADNTDKDGLLPQQQQQT